MSTKPALLKGYGILYLYQSGRVQSNTNSSRSTDGGTYSKIHVDVITNVQHSVRRPASQVHQMTDVALATTSAASVQQTQR